MGKLFRTELFFQQRIDNGLGLRGCIGSWDDARFANNIAKNGKMETMDTFDKVFVHIKYTSKMAELYLELYW